MASQSIRAVSKTMRLALLMGSIWLLGFGAPSTPLRWLMTIIFALAVAGIAVMLEPFVMRAIGDHGEARFDTRNKSGRPD